MNDSPTSSSGLPTDHDSPPRLPPVARWILLVVGVGALLAWGVGQLRTGARLHEAEVLARTDIAALMMREQPPPRPRHALRGADWLSLEAFPPDHRLALAAVEYALRQDPLSSNAWLRVARLRLLLGEEDFARAALAHSDHRDPRFPRQRLESVRLWRMLGDGERALENAERVAALGPHFAREAAEELVLSGVSPVEAFRRVGGAETEPREMAGLLQRLHAASPSSAPQLWDEVPEAARGHRAVLDAGARLFSAPLDAGRLLDLWRLAAQTPTDDGSLFLDNHALAVSPWTNEFPLGWQPFPDGGSHTAVYVTGAGSAAGEGGSVRLDASRFGANFIRWPAYRFVVPAGEALRVSVPVQHQPTGDGRARITIQTSERTVNSPYSNGLREGWQELSVVLPAQDAPSLATMTVFWELPERSLRRTPHALAVHGIDVRPHRGGAQ